MFYLAWSELKYLNFSAFIVLLSHQVWAPCIEKFRELNLLHMTPRFFRPYVKTITLNVDPRFNIKTVFSGIVTYFCVDQEIVPSEPVNLGMCTYR